MSDVTTVDEYIALQPVETQARLVELRAAIREALPEATEGISYGIPTYHVRRSSVSFGAAKRHCALYGSAMHGLDDELRPYSTGRGTVRFPLDKPIPADLIRKLVLRKADGLAEPR